MSTIRLVLLVSLLTVPALTQQAGIPPQIPGRNWTMAPAIRPEPPRDTDMRAMRLQSIHNDAEQLSALSSSLQSDLQQLQNGKLTKDLTENLKKIEKLSKRLRQEVAQ